MEAWVEVHLKLSLQEYAPNQEKPLRFKIVDPCTVRDLDQNLHLPEVESLLIIVNRVQASLETQLKNGDQVKFLPLIAGG